MGPQLSQPVLALTPGFCQTRTSTPTTKPDQDSNPNSALTLTLTFASNPRPHLTDPSP